MRRRTSRDNRMAKAGLSLARILEEYELHLQTEGRSERTVAWYRQKLR